MNRDARIKAFFFGDSICFGQMSSPHHGWVTRLAQLLEECGAAQGAEVTLQNPSVSGNTTRQALERMAYDVQQYGVDMLLIQFGMNDCNYWQTDRGNPRVSKKAFEANLEEMIARGRSFGAREIIMPTNHTTTRTTERMQHTALTYEESNREYNAIIRKVAASQKVELVDMEAIFTQHVAGSRARAQELLHEDGLHLSVKGHDLYYKTLRPVVESALGRLLDNAKSATCAA